MRPLIQCVLTLVVLSLLVETLEGSAEVSIHAEMASVTIVTDKVGYKFDINLNSEGGLGELIVTYDHKRIPVPKEEIPALKEAELRQAYVTTWQGYYSTREPLSNVILVIPFQHEFRKDPEHDPENDEDDTIRVSNVARLLFSDGKIVRWEIAISAGEDSGKWKLTCKDEGEDSREDGEDIVSLVNPYWTYNPINYSTPWLKKN